MHNVQEDTLIIVNGNTSETVRIHQRTLSQEKRKTHDTQQYERARDIKFWGEICSGQIEKKQCSITSWNWNWNTGSFSLMYGFLSVEYEVTAHRIF